MKSVYVIVDTILLLYHTLNTIAGHTNRELGGTVLSRHYDYCALIEVGVHTSTPSSTLFYTY